MHKGSIVAELERSPMKQADICEKKSMQNERVTEECG